MNHLHLIEGLVSPIIIFKDDLTLVYSTPSASKILQSMSPHSEDHGKINQDESNTDSIVFYVNQFKKSGLKSSAFLRSVDIHHLRLTFEIQLKVCQVGEESGIAVVFQDVTSFIQAQGDLLESEDKFRVLANAAQDGVIIIDNLGRVTFWSKAAERIFGYLASDAMGQQLETLVFPLRYHQAFKNGFENWKPQGNDQVGGETLEVSGLHREGHEIRIEFSLSFVKMDQQWNGIGLVRDISERKRVEEALHRSEYKMRSMMESLSDPCFVCSDQFVVEYANPAMKQTFGEVTGESCFYKIFQCEHDCPVCHLKPMTGAVCSNQEIRHPTNGRIFKATSSPMMNSDGSNSKITIFRDITDEKEMQVRLTQSHKLEAIGQLAAGIAHEINTPSQFIGDNIAFLKKNWGSVEKVLQNCIHQPDDLLDLKSKKTLLFLLQEIPKAVDDAGEGIHRITTIVKAMREFSHPNDLKKKVNLNQAIETTLIVARNEWRYIAEIETDLDKNLPEVYCFPGDLNEVILNLIVNAAHAIATKFEPLGKKGVIFIQTYFKNSAVVIEIQDNGSGIPEKIKSRVYDPFFTTKVVGKGTGQGLYLSHQIIEKKHQGRLSFDSQEGEGTTFKIELPMGEKEEEIK